MLNGGSAVTIFGALNMVLSGRACRIKLAELAIKKLSADQLANLSSFKNGILVKGLNFFWLNCAPGRWSA